MATCRSFLSLNPGERAHLMSETGTSFLLHPPWASGPQCNESANNRQSLSDRKLARLRRGLPTLGESHCPILEQTVRVEGDSSARISSPPEANLPSKTVEPLALSPPQYPRQHPMPIFTPASCRYNILRPDLAWSFGPAFVIEDDLNFPTL